MSDKRYKCGCVVVKQWKSSKLLPCKSHEKASPVTKLAILNHSTEES